MGYRAGRPRLAAAREVGGTAAARRAQAGSGKDVVVTCTLHLAWDDRLTRYDFGPSHPLAPVRVELTVELARDFGVLDGPGVSVAAPEPATPADLELVHDPGYIGIVRQVSAEPSAVDLRTLFRYGLGTPDDPVFPGMHEASALVAGATLAAARAVWTGAAEHGINVAGGLHHAMASSASGFCVYNDPAIAITWLLGQGAERVAYVDIDVHHGDGVQAAFWADPRVLTISLHEHPATLFPGTGLPTEIGAAGAEGSAVNVALPAGTRDAGWLRAFHATVPQLLREFRPQVLVSQHGCDTHWSDPLANLELTIDAQRAAHAAIHQLAHATAGGRWLATGGGGPPDRPAGGNPRDMARVRAPPHRADRARLDDRGPTGRVHLVRLGIRPRGASRPGDHGHQERRVPAQWPDATSLKEAGQKLQGS